MLLLYRLMVLTKQINISTYFIIAALSVMLGNMYAVQNSLLLKSWANTPQILDAQFGNNFVNVQANTPSQLQDPAIMNQSTSGLSEDGGSNNTGTESMNQSSSGLSEEGAINENTSQTTQTEQNLNQTQNNNQQVNQTQTNNQQVNVNNSVNNNVNNQIQVNQKLEAEISEEEGVKPIPLEEQKNIESRDVIVIREHKALTGPDCRSGDVLNGASNEKDLRILSECQDAVGVVKHTKKMDDGDYKFFLEVDSKYNFLLNDKNRDKTDGFLVVEIVPKDQDAKTVFLPKSGDKVHIWGAWVTDKPKGWHEIHPAWKVVKE